MKEEGARGELLDWLFGLENMGIKLGLDNMRILLEALGNPQDSYSTIHVAGTNGKGSVSAFLASILSAEGYRTGLYTSPHFVDFEERIKVNGKQISEKELIDTALEVRGVAEKLFRGERRQITFFEITTAIAFLYFSRMRVDYAVVEVGLGGRLDATNVITPLISVITHVALEHTAYLGDTIRQIAFEKGGIIKPGVPVITAETKTDALDEMERLASAGDSEMVRKKDLAEVNVIENSWGALRVGVRGMREYPDLASGLWGSYQIENIGLAVSAAELLQRLGVYISDGSVANGIVKVRWPGRMQLGSLGRGFLFDSAHNPDAMSALSRSIRDVTAEDFVCVLGVLSDKKLEDIVAQIAVFSTSAVCVSPDTPRARPAEELRESAERNGIEAVVAEGVREGMDIARGEAAGRKVVVTGSLRTVGEAMEWWYAENGEKLWI